MSYLSYTGVERPQFTVAIVGITGGLGKEAASIFLKEYKPFFPTVVGTTRDKNTDTAKSLAALGADIREVADDDNEEAAFVKVFQGVDVVIDTLGSPAAKTKNVVIQAVAKAGVPLFIPSEFGVDYRTNDFPGFDYKEFTSKAERNQIARQLFQDKTKVICVYVSAWLEYISPHLGFDTANQKFTVFGSRDQRITFTSTSDISHALAELSILSLTPATAGTVPDHVHIAGTTHSVNEIKEIVQRVQKEVGIKDGKEIEIVEENLDGVIEKLKQEAKEGRGDLFAFLRTLMGQGKMDFSNANDNELVNPGGKVWKWRSLEDHTRAVGGKFWE